MIPIVTPAEMAAIDAAAPVPVAALVERAAEYHVLHAHLGALGQSVGFMG